MGTSRRRFSREFKLEAVARGAVSNRCRGPSYCLPPSGDTMTKRGSLFVHRNGAGPQSPLLFTGLPCAIAAQ